MRAAPDTRRTPGVGSPGLAQNRDAGRRSDNGQCTAHHCGACRDRYRRELGLYLAGIPLILEPLARHLDADQLDEIERRLLERAITGAVIA